MATEKPFFLKGPTTVRRSRVGRTLDPNWNYLRGYSTGSLLKLIETLKDEFEQRGCRLTVEVDKSGSPDQDVVG